MPIQIDFSKPHAVPDMEWLRLSVCHLIEKYHLEHYCPQLRVKIYQDETSRAAPENLWEFDLAAQKIALHFNNVAGTPGAAHPYTQDEWSAKLESEFRRTVLGPLVLRTLDPATKKALLEGISHTRLQPEKKKFWNSMAIRRLGANQFELAEDAFCDAVNSSIARPDAPVKLSDNNAKLVAASWNETVLSRQRYLETRDLKRMTEDLCLKFYRREATVKTVSGREHELSTLEAAPFFEELKLYLPTNKPEDVTWLYPQTVDGAYSGIIVKHIGNKAIQLHLNHATFTNRSRSFVIHDHGALAQASMPPASIDGGLQSEVIVAYANGQATVKSGVMALETSLHQLGQDKGISINPQPRCTYGSLGEMNEVHILQKNAWATTAATTATPEYVAHLAENFSLDDLMRIAQARSDEKFAIGYKGSEAYIVNLNALSEDIAQASREENATPEKTQESKKTQQQASESYFIQTLSRMQKTERTEEKLRLDIESKENEKLQTIQTQMRDARCKVAHLDLARQESKIRAQLQQFEKVQSHELKTRRKLDTQALKFRNNASVQRNWDRDVLNHRQEIQAEELAQRHHLQQRQIVKQEPLMRRPIESEQTAQAQALRMESLLGIRVAERMHLERRKLAFEFAHKELSLDERQARKELEFEQKDAWAQLQHDHTFARSSLPSAQPDKDACRLQAQSLIQSVWGPNAKVALAKAGIYEGIVALKTPDYVLLQPTGAWTEFLCCPHAMFSTVPFVNLDKTIRMTVSEKGHAAVIEDIAPAQMQPEDTESNFSASTQLAQEMQQDNESERGRSTPYADQAPRPTPRSSQSAPPVLSRYMSQQARAQGMYL